MRSRIKVAHVPLTIERNDDGFLARCPMVQGAFAEGDSVTEAITNCLDVLNMIVEYRRERAEPMLSAVTEALPMRKEIAFTVPIEV